MRLSPDTIKTLAAKRGMNLATLLARAGVSKTAYYSLTRKDSVFPKSVGSLAEALGVSPSDLVIDREKEARRAKERMSRVAELSAKYPSLDVDNVRHTLILLDLEPEERLRRALLRGQTFDFHG